jgi:hypothetical protein
MPAEPTGVPSPSDVDRSDPGQAESGELGRRGHVLARHGLLHRTEAAVGASSNHRGSQSSTSTRR